MISEVQRSTMNHHFCSLVLMTFVQLLMAPESGTTVELNLDKHDSVQDKCKIEEYSNKMLPPIENSNYSKLANMIFLIEEPDICAKIRPNISLLIYVHSAPSHFKNRAQIRHTYGSSALYHELGTVTLFLIGRSEDIETDRTVRLESQRYHDIIMADYYDSPQNLTLKAISALTWITRHCKQVPYVLKTDDDVLVNVFNVVRYVELLRKYESYIRHIHCSVRNMTDINEDDDGQETIPEHCSSTGFLMQGSIVPILHGGIAKVPYSTLDNVHVTGLLRMAVGTIELNNIASVVADTIEEYVSNKDAINEDGLFGRLNGDKELKLIKDYWDDIWQKHQV